MFDDDQDNKPHGNEIILGEDLYDFSLDDLRGRIELLQVEIVRLENTIQEKQAHLGAADALFGKQ